MFAPTSAAALSASLTPTPRKWKWLNLPIGTPFDLIAIDLFGPLPVTRRGNNHILVIIDHHKRWVELVPLPNPTAAQVAQALFNKWISRWAHRGPYCETTARSSQPSFFDNSARRSASLTSLRPPTTLAISRQEWDVVLPAAALAYRCTPHSVTRFSSFFLVAGQELVLPLSRQWTEPILHPCGARWLHALWRCRLAVLPSHQRVADANRRLFLEDPHLLEPGTHVAFRIPANERAAQGKFSSAFRGPYVVERVLPTGTTAELVDPVSGTKLLANRTRLRFLDAPQLIVARSGSARGHAIHPGGAERQRAESAEPRIVKFVVGKFRPSDLKDIKNAKKRLAKPQTQEALQHKETIYLHKQLKAYKGAREEVWKVAGGLLRLPVERGWTPPRESLVAKMKGHVEDSPAVKEVWAAPRWGTPSWTSFLTSFSRQFIAQPSARVRGVRSWKEIPEYEPEIQPDPNPVGFISSALQGLGGPLAPRARHDEEDSDEVIEARPALLRPASSGASPDLKGSAELSPLPAPRAPGSGRAAPQTAPTSPAAPPPGRPGAQRPLEPLSSATVVAFNALGTLAAQGWDCMATCCVWWTLAAAQDYRTARENFAYRLRELQRVNSLSRTVATAHAVLTSPSHAQSSAEALVDQLSREQLCDKPPQLSQL
ncbi:hypothetical protein Emag_007431 [Eimeria magna]